MQGTTIRMLLRGLNDIKEKKEGGGKPSIFFNNKIKLFKVLNQISIIK
jgi:hypothetical protein